VRSSWNGQWILPVWSGESPVRVCYVVGGGDGQEQPVDFGAADSRGCDHPDGWPVGWVVEPVDELVEVVPSCLVEFDQLDGHGRGVLVVPRGRRAEDSGGVD